MAPDARRWVDVLTAVRPGVLSGGAALRRVAVAVLVVTGAIAVALPQVGASTPDSRVAHLAIGASVMACGLVLLVARPFSRVVVTVAAFATVAAIGVLVWLSEPMSVEPLLMAGPVLLLAADLERWTAIGALGFVVVALVGGLLLNPDPVAGRPMVVAAIAAVVVVTLLGAVGRGRGRGARGREGAAEPGGPLSEPELRARLALLAEISVVEGTGLALVLAAPRETDRRAIMPVLMEALAQQSRTDDLLARFGDAIGILLPGARYEEACGYAARVAEVLHRPAPDGIGTSIDVGIALVYDEPYPDAAVLRRGRLALDAARRADDGLVALCEPEGMLLLDAVAVAALIAQDRAADEHAGRTSPGSSRRRGPGRPGS